MQRLSVLALAGLTAVALLAATPGIADDSPGAPANVSGAFIQYQHDASMPQQLEGVGIHVTGIPGTSYKLYLLFRDGTRMPIGTGVIPIWGTHSYAWAHPHDHVPQRHQPVEVWSRSRAPIVAHVTLMD